MFEDTSKATKKVFYDEKTNQLVATFYIDVDGMSKERVEDIITDFNLQAKNKVNEQGNEYMQHKTWTQLKVYA